jgi:molybdopterin synthase sulfur carrier subunit
VRVRIRFFARFRELFGPEVTVQTEEGTTLTGLIHAVVRENHEGEEAIFDREGRFRRFVIIMKNGIRMDTTRAEEIQVSEGDDIAVFPPVAGG